MHPLQSMDYTPINTTIYHHYNTMPCKKKAKQSIIIFTYNPYLTNNNS